MVFLDIGGAFERIPVVTKLRALRRRNIDDTIVLWNENLLSCKYINTSLNGNDLIIHASAVCSQGSILPPILWCLVVNSLLENLKSLNIFCIGYAADVDIVI